jgi:dCTP deaminase
MITPVQQYLVSPNVISYGLSSYGYDARAGYEWHIFENKPWEIIDPKNVTSDHYEIKQTTTPIVIPPHSYALTHSVERFKLPRDITGLCIGKSSYARVGLHVNITPLEAEWEGQVTIEISNATGCGVKVYPGEGIMQVLFFRGKSHPISSYADRDGKYQNQMGVTHSRVKLG